MSKKVLVTGASGGFGKPATLSLLEKGHTVVGSMRDMDGKNKAVAEELRDAGAHIVEMDVTFEASVARGVATAMDMALGLDVVVNNAGVGVIGLQEAFTAEDWKTLFEVNVFGVQRVNREVLPHLREQKSGLLIFVSSLLGRITIPFYGPYNASKWALEAMAENYRAELSRFGIDSCVVEPGGFATDFRFNLLRPTDTDRGSAYGDFAEAPMQMFSNFDKALESNPEQNPQRVADAICNLVDTPPGQRRFRTVVDRMGMGDLVDPYNDQLERIHSGVYGALGMEDLLKLKA
jgi:NAD(P)-dependent dehydrogenase (short-subunit alcohol dehydrogenase family)